jgi:hypothetical protein
MKYPKRSQYRYAKSPYRIRNWPQYEAGLRSRGDLTIWLSDTALDAWRAPPSGRPGGQRTYADIAIEAALTIRMVFHLPLRQTEGFLRSLAHLLEVEVPIPDHTALSRRLRTLGEIPVRTVEGHRPIHRSSIRRDSGFTSVICGSHRSAEPGGSCTAQSIHKQARSSPWI